MVINMVQSMITTDVFDTYTYFYIDMKTKHGFLIDPGAEADRILDFIAKKGWVIEKILLTHVNAVQSYVLDVVPEVMVTAF